MAMFESLQGISLAVAAPAVHYAIQWIRQWAGVRRGKFAVLPDDKTIPPEAVRIADQIVAEIESAEGVQADQLPPERVRQYIEALADALQTVASRELHTNEDRGKAILESFRTRWK